MASDERTYDLMCEDRVVATILYDGEKATARRIVGIQDAFDIDRMPVGTVVDGTADLGNLNRWWAHRRIPASREHIARIVEELDLGSPLDLAERSLGLSLSDRYWMRATGSGIAWRDVNFFDNGFSEELGLSLESGDFDIESLDSMSPDATADGALRKRWKIMNGERWLLKSGSDFANLEAYNEAAASALHRRLLDSNEYVDYRLVEIRGRTYSACANMLGPHEELVPAALVMRSHSDASGSNDLERFLDAFERSGIENVRASLAKMFACDFIIANRDRH